ncbi:MAG TPA: hypothetical protein VKQ72_10085 [Aggregatilineales bacterium]|nr:hypothetical protein [Aggregatilineales bacterium]
MSITGRFLKILMGFRITLMALAACFLVSSVLIGTVFAPRGFTSGDDWTIMAGSILGHYSSCIATNYQIPWRSLQPTSVCLAYWLSGLNVDGLFMASIIAYALAAFAWYGIVRNLFKLSAWIALLIGLLYLAYPDSGVRFTLTHATRMTGGTLTLYGVWLILEYWDRPATVKLIGACILALLGFATYEMLFVVWVVGLPLALLYKSRRFSRRWLAQTAVIFAVALVYLAWRFLVLPTTYGDQTFIFGAHEIAISIPTIFHQLIDSYLLTGQLWIHLVLDFRGAVNDLNVVHTPQIITISVLTGLLTALLVWLVYRAELRIPPPTPKQGRLFFWGMLLFIPIFSGTFFATSDLNFLTDTYRSFGTTFAISVGVVGLLILLTTPRLFGLVATTLTVVMIVVQAAWVGYSDYNWRDYQAPGCDFFLRLTDTFPHLPPNLYVILKPKEVPALPDFFNDAYMLTPFYAALYDEGSFTPEAFDYGHMGYNGYLMFAAPDASFTPDGIALQWPTYVGIIHRGAPLPDLAPYDQTLMIAYAPNQTLDILWQPPQLNALERSLSINNPQPSRAQNLARQYCSWYTPPPQSND